MKGIKMSKRNESLRNEIFALRQENRKLRKKIARLNSKKLTQETWERSIDLMLGFLARAKNLDIKNLKG